MRIVYLIHYNPVDNGGVVEKIKQQSSEWKRRGYIVYLVSSKTMSIYNLDLDILFQNNTLEINFGRVGTALQLLYNAFYINKLLKNIEYDIIYMRYMLYMPFFTNVLKTNKVVMEINSDDSKEYRLHSKLTHYYNLITRNLFLSHIDAFVSVSRELRKKFLYLNKEIIVIGNGIDSKKFPLTIVPYINPRPILVFIGSPNQEWHGIDKIEIMAKYFSHYQFYVIGIKADELENIKYFGYLSQEKAVEIIEKSDIGIGTLSLYKKGLEEASPLKTRQYLSCGLPIIYAYKDTDLSEVSNFALKLKNREDNLDYDRIEEFVSKVVNNQEIKRKAKVFASEVLDYEKKECIRCNFFIKVLNEN